MAHIEKRGPNRYRARYRKPGGRERSRTFTRKADAERWLNTEGADLVRGDWTDPALGRLRFGEWVDKWEDGIVDLRPTTRQLNVGVARNYLVPRFGTWPLATITASEIKVMLAEELVEGRLSNSAVRRHVLVLSTILQAAVADGRIGRNPAAGVKLPPEDSRPLRFLEPEEVARLGESVGSHYRPLVLTAAYAGLRRGELFGLRVSNVDLLRRTIRVEEQLQEVGGKLLIGPPKTKAGTRSVSIPTALAEILGEHFGSDAVRSSGMAFPGPFGALTRASSFRRAWLRGCSAAELGWRPSADVAEQPDGTYRARYRSSDGKEHVKDFHRKVDANRWLLTAGADRTKFEPDDGPVSGLTLHDLRHTAVALAIAQGAHPLAIKERLGHSSITTTLDTYGALFPSLDLAIADSLDDVLRSSLDTPNHSAGATVIAL